MATKKTTNYIVAVAECDENNSDGFSIDNALVFATPEDAAKFIVEDFNDTIIGMVETGYFNEDELLDEKAVLKKIKQLKIEKNAEWNTPEGTPTLIKWKIFRKG